MVNFARLFYKIWVCLDVGYEDNRTLDKPVASLSCAILCIPAQLGLGVAIQLNSVKIKVVNYNICIQTTVRRAVGLLVAWLCLLS